MAKKDKESEKKPEPAAQTAQQLERSKFVETLASYGMPPEEIGLLMVPAISGEAVKAEFARELEMGPAKANLETVAGLRGAVKKGNVTAMIYWTKARMGWTEKGPGAAKENIPPSETSEPVTEEGIQGLARSLNSSRILPFPGKS